MVGRVEEVGGHKSESRDEGRGRSRAVPMTRSASEIIVLMYASLWKSRLCPNGFVDEDE